MSDIITFYHKYALICLASLNSEIFLFPSDNIKTKIQYNNKTFVNTFKHTINNNGYSSLYKGFIPSVTRHWVYTGLRIGLYEELKNKYNIENSNIFGKILISGFSGALSQCIASPFDMVKINSINSSSSNIQIIKNIYNKSGFIGFYKGVGPNMLRAVGVNIGEIGTYDIVKRHILSIRNKEDMYTFTISSFFSGFFSSLLCTPADVIRTKMMVQDNNIVYRNTLDCIVKTIQNNGAKTLYTGFTANWLRLAPWQMIFWNSYEFYRVYFGFENF